MSLSTKRWVWPDHNSNSASILAEKFNIFPAFARLLVARGIEDPAYARAFLSPSLNELHSPWLLKGMAEAVARLNSAIEKKEKVMIYGDYDADGITAAVIMVEALQQFDANVDLYLPSRFEEGYGLHRSALEQFIDHGVSLIVTVDCGVNAVLEAEFAASAGLDLIITDHHQPVDSLPLAVSIINPLQKGCTYPFKDLSGSGIAFKLAEAFMDSNNAGFPSKLLDLAALGTAADVVPLLNENRVIVSAGLTVLCQLERAGFRALVDAVKLDRKRINSTTLTFAIAPAINAAGRMGDALPAAQLLLESDPDNARLLAEKLHRSNQERRNIEKSILQEAEKMASEQVMEEGNRVITLGVQGWHHGVIGIVASRLVDKFFRPVVLVAIDEKEGRGSARSIPGFDITAALAHSSALLERFGGHEQAAGFTILPENMDRLSDALNQYARESQDSTILICPLYIETELKEDEIELGFVEQIEKMQPHGMANPVPIFGSREWEILSWFLVGADQKHLKIDLKKNGRTISAIYFSGAAVEPFLEKSSLVDIAFKLRTGTFRNQKTMDVQLEDLQYSDSLITNNIRLIDRRQKPERLNFLRESLIRADNSVLIFTSTAFRANKIRQNCPINDQSILISNGSYHAELEFPENISSLVLYDLPVSEDFLKLIFSMAVGKTMLTVYLLYNEEDRSRNARIIDLSLPSVKQLENIMSIYSEAVSANSELYFPGPAAEVLAVPPESKFWERTQNILKEIGLLEGNRLSPRWPAVKSSWPELLDTSPSYKAASELRARCEQFQDMLLNSTLEEIAAHLQSLLVN